MRILTRIVAALALLLASGAATAQIGWQTIGDV